MEETRYIAFLRGINVGGHHKVPMAELRVAMEKLKCKNLITILNSGNIIFDVKTTAIEQLQQTISAHLEKTFGFPIPTIVRTSEMILQLLKDQPFKEIEVTKDTRLYVTFLPEEREGNMQLPWKSEDNSYRILLKKEQTICSVLDVSVSQTPKAMGILEKSYGKDITTRNWNTILRIEKKLNA